MNSLPIIGWILSLTFTTSTAVPFWIAWTACGVGERYFYFLPDVYHGVSFWGCVGAFLCVGILKRVLTPSFVTVTQTNSDSK